MTPPPRRLITTGMAHLSPSRGSSTARPFDGLDHGSRMAPPVHDTHPVSTALSLYVSTSRTGGGGLPGMGSHPAAGNSPASRAWFPLWGVQSPLLTIPKAVLEGWLGVLKAPCHGISHTSWPGTRTSMSCMSGRGSPSPPCGRCGLPAHLCRVLRLEPSRSLGTEGENGRAP